MNNIKTSMKFSLILPVYNVEKYLNKCLQSILNQTFTDFEVILVDDGSKDSSLQICEKYAAMDCRIKVIKKENGGVSSARNAGIECAIGEWIVFIDPDDWISNDCLEVCNKKIELFDTDAICFNSTKVLEANDYEEKSMRDISPDNSMIHSDKMHEILYALAVSSYQNNYYCGEMVRAVWGKVLRTDVIRENKICFDTRLTHGEDCVFLMDFFSRCRSCVLVNNSLYFYNIRKGSAVTSGPDNFEKLYRYQFTQIYKRLEPYLQENECQSVLSACKLGCAKNYLKALNKLKCPFLEKWRRVKQYFNSCDFSYGKYKKNNKLHLHKREILGCKLLDLRLYLGIVMLYVKI